MVVEVKEEGDVAEEFHDGHGDAERVGEQHRWLLIRIDSAGGNLENVK